MKKLLQSTLLALLLGGSACSDSEPQTGQNLLIAPDQTEATLPAAETTHTIRFETAADWEAAAKDEATSAEPKWLSLSPRSGGAGEQTVTATLAANTGQSARKAVVTLSCAGELATVTIVQEAAAGSSRPERPEVAAENLLSLVEIETVSTYSGRETTTSQTIHVTYDEENWPAQLTCNTLGSAGTQLTESHAQTFSFGKNQMRAGSFVATLYTFDQLPALLKKEFTTTYSFSNNGLLRKSNYQILREQNVTASYTYNPDGSLATSSRTTADQSDTETKSASYEWADGDLQTIDAQTDYFGVISSTVTTFAYTEHPVTWHGIDITALVLEQETDIASLLGVIGLGISHLPSERRLDNGQVYSYEYSFDAQNRISTIAISTDWRNENTTKTFTLHYGAQPAPRHDFPVHLTAQEVAEEGTLGYTFAAATPEDRTVAADSYTSWAKIRSVLSDGTTQEAVKYVPVSWTAVPQKSQTRLISAAEFAGLELTSVSVRQDSDGTESDRKLQYTVLANYGEAFSVSAVCTAAAPTCALYDSTTKKGSVHVMPTFTLSPEQLHGEALELSETGTNTYLLRQKLRIGFNPETEETIGCTIEQQLKVAE